MPAAAAGLTGLVAIAALLPLRGNWLVGLLLTGLRSRFPACSHCARCESRAQRCALTQSTFQPRRYS